MAKSYREQSHHNKVKCQRISTREIRILTDLGIGIQASDLRGRHLDHLRCFAHPDIAGQYIAQMAHVYTGS